jgi:hypothetical protein
MNFFEYCPSMKTQIDNHPVLYYSLTDAQKKLGYQIGGWKSESGIPLSLTPFARHIEFNVNNYKEADVQFFLDKIRYAYGVKVLIYCDNTSPFDLINRVFTHPGIYSH